MNTDTKIIVPQNLGKSSSTTTYVSRLVQSNDPILTTGLPIFDFDNPIEDPVIVAKKLAETMILHGGLGLSANQIGLQSRACVIQSNPIIAMFNPVITAMADEFSLLEEGCLSFPNLVVNIKRPVWVRVRYKEPNGNVVTNKFYGMTARAICHEIDHLNGILFYQRASRYHLDRAKKNLKNLQRKIKKGTA